MDYLIDLESKLIHNRELLTRINIGVIAAREIENLDMPIALDIYKVCSEVTKMLDE